MLRAAPLHGPDDRARIALVGQTALLLGGDEVELDVRLGPRARLELVEIAGTVAYDGRGHRARWSTRIELAAQAELCWAGEPFVVADGADVDRATSVRMAADARLMLRETLVLGRSGERGGPLRVRTDVVRDGRAVLVEDLRLDPELRRGPGLLGGARVLDSLIEIGPEIRPGSAPPMGPAATCFELAEDGATLIRYLGPETATSPLRRPQLPADILSR